MSSLALAGGESSQPTATALTIRGNSMAPCLKHGQKILVTNFSAKPATDKTATEKPELNSGDIIVFKRKNKQVLKRVVAKAGDRFELVQDKTSGCFKILINEKPLKTLSAKEYCTSRKTLQTFSDAYKKVLPKDHVLVMGEVPAGSEDSSLFGPLPVENIIAKASSNKCSSL